MRFGFADACLSHDPGPRHPERPERLEAIREGLERRHGVSFVRGDDADREAIERAHDPDYVADIESFCERGGGNWDPDTVATEATWPAALASAGQAVWAAEAALAGDDGRDAPFALGRPPGHHATADDAMGFCFVNNAAVAAEAALEAGADRVAVLDWDVHHGNGTQDIFAERADVPYCSVHEEDLYPGTGDPTETGTGDGAGATLNVALPPGSGDADYGLVFGELVAPAVAAWSPDLVLVSAGFDAHRHDPISRMHLSTEGFGQLAARVREMADRADAGLGFVLEGGYGLDTLSEGVGMVHEVFDGYEPAAPDGEPDPAVRERVAAGRERMGIED